MWCFQLSNFDHMYSYGILTWYRYLRLGHNPFFSPLVTFMSCPTRAYPLSFHFIIGVLILLLVIYLHFLDITLRHTLSFFHDWEVWFLAYSNHLVAFSCSCWGIHLLSLCFCAWLFFFGFFSTHPNFTFFGTCPDSTFPGTCLNSFPVLAWIWSPVCLIFSGTRPDTISSPASCLDLLNSSDSRLDLISFSLVYSGIVSGSPDFFQHRVRFPLVFLGIVYRFL